MKHGVSHPLLFTYESYRGKSENWPDVGVVTDNKRKLSEIIG